jgi:PmbA protein
MDVSERKKASRKEREQRAWIGDDTSADILYNELRWLDKNPSLSDLPHLAKFAPAKAGRGMLFPSEQLGGPHQPTNGGGKMAGENLLQILTSLVRQSPADQTEALLLTEDSSLARFTPNSIHQHVAERNGTLVLRVVLEKQIAVVTTNILAPSSLKASLDRAVSLARLLPPNEDFRSLPKPRSIPQINTFFENIRTLTPLKMVRTVQEIQDLARESGHRASGAFSRGEVEVAVVNSLGVEAYQRYSDLFLHLIIQKDNSSGYASFVSRDPSRLQVEPLVKRGISKVSGASPVEIDPGEYEVVLEPDAVHELLTFLGSLGFHSLSVQEGRSFFCGRFGQKLVDEGVTVYDDGLDPQGLQVPFDFEGVPKNKVVFIEHGTAKEVTYDSFTAGREGRQSTGHGLIPPNTEGPVPLNLFLEGGSSSLEEMVRHVRRGIYVTRFHYTNVVEPMKAVITGMTRDGTFLIEEGEIKSPVRNLRFTQSILKALSSVKAISRERKVCSGGSVYGRRFVTGTVVPALQIEGFHFSGVSPLVKEKSSGRLAGRNQ